jgi:hypothetical protein
MVPKASWKEGKLMTANTNYSVISTVQESIYKTLNLLVGDKSSDGISPQVILAGRRIYDGMGAYVASPKVFVSAIAHSLTATVIC